MRFWLRLLLFLLALPLQAQELQPPPMALQLEPGVAPKIIALLADPGFETPLEDGFTLDSIAIGQDRIVCTLHQNGVEMGKMLLTPKERAQPGQPQSASFAIEIQTRDPHALRLLQRAQASVLRRDTTDLYAHFSLLPQLAVTFGGLLLWAILLLLRRQPLRFTFAARAHHLLPSALQLAMFTYWSFYWPPVRAHMLLDVPLQLAFGLLFDALWSLTLRRQWEAGFAVFPIVLSTNLFIWFPPDWLWLGFLVVALALMSKTLFRRADGRHVFNPSAFGIAIIGLLVVTGTGVRYQDIALQLAMPPHMLEVFFILALVPHLRFATAGLSLFAALAMLLVLALVPGSLRLPTPFWPAWFLTITLFAGDPMTVARSFFGRLLHGFFLGLGVSFFAFVLVRMTGLDYFAKVFPVVATNLAVPLFDRIGLYLDQKLLRQPATLPPPTGRPNLALRWLPAMAWVVVFLLRE